jgi:hypothetical protein
MDLLKEGVDGLSYLNLPNNVWRLIVFAPFLIKSPKQSLGDLLFLLCFLLLFLFFLSVKISRQISGTTGQNFMKLGGVIDICF